VLSAQIPKIALRIEPRVIEARILTEPVRNVFRVLTLEAIRGKVRPLLGYEDRGLRGRRNPFVASEGVWPLLLTLAAALYIVRFHDPWVVLLPAALFVFLFLLFRDPHRDVPSVALGIVSPVDGEVLEVETSKHCVVQGEAYRIRIRVNALGTYTARSPIEGRIMDLSSKVQGPGAECPANALWIETDEGDSVVLQFHDSWLGFAPKSFIRLGERVGQGDRCAYLRLARIAELSVPIAGRVHVKPGQKVKAGIDLIGAVPHP
jgi:phosphatidylserine decarboxylase